MSAATQYYLATILVYIAVNAIAAWGLDLQFGVTGVLNFAFVLFQAAGAYVAAMLSLGPSSADGGFQRYLIGVHLPFPLPILGAMLFGGVLSGLIGLITLRRLRSDYQAMVMLVVSVVATVVVESVISLANGSAGLSLIPNPADGLNGLTRQAQTWVFVAICAVCTLIVGILMYALLYSPYGRVLRGTRENEAAIEAMGRNATAARMQVFVLGGALGALSGALLAEFIGAWAPSDWLYPETFVFFTAVIVGGRGSVLGVAVGSALVCVGVQQAVQYLPIGSDPTVLASLEWIITGLLTMLFLWARPQGLLPERRRRFTETATQPAEGSPGAGGGTG
ncbi:MAG TPA: branched-chain amino acid ABC transporter permease [Solirubrobacteraceae bacterium]|nr:branched-chain amino acid ABC transporter permease [Solirubrobacteraceae bacterium]